MPKSKRGRFLRMPTPTQNSTTAAMDKSDLARFDAEAVLVSDSQPEIHVPIPSSLLKSSLSTSDSVQQPPGFKTLSNTFRTRGRGHTKVEDKNTERKTEDMHIGAAQNLVGKDLK